MRPRRTRAPFVVTLLLSLSLVACFGGHGGGGGGGGGNGGGGGGGGNGGGGLIAVFQISKSHTGNFQQGQQKATYTITVTNTGTGPTAGNVQVNDTLPSGETLVSMSGSGWTFPGGAVATRIDALAAGQSWPSITLTVNIASNAASPQVNTVSVSGGGASSATAQDSTTIISTVSLLFGRFAFLFSGFDANGAVAVAGSINVNANGNVTGEEDFKDPKTLLTAASVSGNCQNLPITASGFCNLTAGGKTSRYDFVLRNNFVVARLAEDPVDAPNGCGPGFPNSSCGSGILINQQVPNSNALTTAGGFNGFFSASFSGTDAAGMRIGVEGNIFTNLGAAIVPQGGIPSQADINDNGTLISPVDSVTTNVIGSMTGPVDQNGRAAMTMTVGTSPSRTLTLALYILAPEVPTTSQSGRAFAVDITPLTTNAQVLSGQLFWLGNPLPTFDNTSASGVNAFALWGIVAGAPATSDTTIGTLNATTGQLLFDSNFGGKVNGTGGVNSPQSGTVSVPINVAANGRAQLSVMVNGSPSTYVLYLDAANDGNMMGATVGGSPDTTTSFGFFTGQVSTSKFNNTTINGTYVSGTDSPVLPGVPNAVSPVTVTPTGSSGTTFTGSFSAGSTSGTYSFSQTTGRATALASSGQLFQNKNAVFYIITPNLFVVMGADQGVTTDAIGFIQF
jgi:uncharacterized repeat protein (TIGR01451 family)